MTDYDCVIVYDRLAVYSCTRLPDCLFAFVYPAYNLLSTVQYRNYPPQTIMVVDFGMVVELVHVCQMVDTGDRLGGHQITNKSIYSTTRQTLHTPHICTSCISRHISSPHPYAFVRRCLSWRMVFDAPLVNG